MKIYPSSSMPANDSEPSSLLEERLLREERHVAEALLHRSRLLGEIASRKRESRKPGAGHELEKALWKVWENVLQREEVGKTKHWRQFVAQCNNLGYAMGEQRASQSQQAWILRPTAPSKPIQLPGLSDVFASKILTFWAAAANVSIKLTPVALNDGLIELIKALNQTGAGLSWENETITHNARQNFVPALENKTIHAGQHEFTLALMLALALGRPGIAKFSGSGTLNMLQLKPWQNVFPQLGARLQQLNPHAPGIPARLESSGNAAHASIGAEVPGDLVWALLAAAPFYPQGLHLTWPEGAFDKPELEILSLLFAQFGVPFKKLANGIQVSPATPTLPEQPSGFLDPGLSALLLAWSRLNNQQLTLQGVWPGQSRWADQYLEVLRSSGMRVDPGPDCVLATPQPWPPDPILDVRLLPQALPLAMALALCAPKECIVLSTQSVCELEVVSALARLTGRVCIQDGATVYVRLGERNSNRMGETLEAPDAFWGMALALISFRHPGISLANPGELTTLWPRFWSIYQNVLSVPKTKFEDKHAKASEKNADEQSEKRKRRVRI